MVRGSGGWRAKMSTTPRPFELAAWAKWPICTFGGHPKAATSIHKAPRGHKRVVETCSSSVITPSGHFVPSGHEKRDGHTLADSCYAQVKEAIVGSRRSKRDWVIRWLEDLLSRGACPARGVLQLAHDQGISNKALRRAYRELGGKPSKSSFDGSWVRGLPARSEVATQPGDESETNMHVPEGALQMPTCATCRFFADDRAYLTETSNGVGDGECRRTPPVVSEYAAALGRFPRVWLESFCGEHQPQIAPWSRVDTDTATSQPNKP